MSKKEEYQKKAEATIAARQTDDRARILEELKKTPIVRAACNRAGIHHATYYRWIEEDASFAAAAKAAMDEGVLFVNDMGEAQLLQLIKNANWPALSFWLRNRHPSYRPKMELSGEIKAKPEPLTAEDKALMRRVLRMALPEKRKRSSKVDKHDNQEYDHEEK